MGLVMSEPRLRRPYIPMGVTQQGRLTPTKLCEAHPDRRIAEKMETRGLADLLLSSGAVEGPFKRTHPVTRGALNALRLYLSIALQALRRIT